jgi:hypothetical protein
MPYTTEKSMIFQVTESWLNSSRTTALGALWHLVDHRPISDMAPVASSNLNYPPVDTVDKRKAHVEEHWWGRKKDATGAWVDQDTYDPVNNPTTGFWKHWYGHAEPVFRETMIRALCISLKISRSTAERSREFGVRKPAWLTQGSQHWPISILWKCPSPWYEGWVEFKDYGAARSVSAGHVTVVLSTPSHGVKLYDSPIRPVGSPTVKGDPYHAYALNPDEPAGPEGLWVVSQAAHTQIPNAKAAPTGAGDWTPPTLGQPVYSAGPVVTVSPAVPDGGAAPPGMPYQP